MFGTQDEVQTPWLFHGKAKAPKGSPTWSWTGKSETFECWGDTWGSRQVSDPLHLCPICHTGVWPR